MVCLNQENGLRFKYCSLPPLPLMHPLLEKKLSIQVVSYKSLTFPVSFLWKYKFWYNMITLWYLLWKCHCPYEDNTWLLWDAIPLKKHWRIDGGLSANKENGLCLHHLFFRDLFCCRICICVFELTQAFFARIFQSEQGNREESWGVSCCPCKLDLTMCTCSIDKLYKFSSNHLITCAYAPKMTTEARLSPTPKTPGWCARLL